VLHVGRSDLGGVTFPDGGTLGFVLAGFIAFISREMPVFIINMSNLYDDHNEK
jgi:hypothetical protein